MLLLLFSALKTDLVHKVVRILIQVLYEHESQSALELINALSIHIDHLNKVVDSFL